VSTNLGGQASSLASEKQDDDGFLGPEEAYRLFDEHVRARLGMSGEELARRWDAGEYQDRDETSLDGEIIGLMMMRPRGRAKPE
jgi:hypothetical protein